MTAARRPGAHWPGTVPPASAHPSFGLRAKSVFCNRRFQHLPIQTQVRHQLLQPPVLVFQLFEPPRFVHFQPAILGFPRVDRMLGHAILPRHLVRRPPCSTCFSAEMICASVCLLLLMDRSLFQIRNHTRCCADLGEQVRSLMVTIPSVDTDLLQGSELRLRLGPGPEIRFVGSQARDPIPGSKKSIL